MSYPQKAGQPPSGAPSGQHPPPGAPGQYPPPGVPGQYPPPGIPGQYPPPGAPGQYPPPGAPNQYPPPGAPGQYPPPGAPGQYPPPGAPAQYPPPGAPGQYPPPTGVSGQYPPSGAPGQYPPPGAPGQYPPPGAPGQYPPPGAPGQYPPSGVPGQYPQGSYPHGPPASMGAHGVDAENSDNDTSLRAKHSSRPVDVKFVNRTNQKVVLCYLNERGKCKKITKLKEGRSDDISTFETHPFLALPKKGRDVVIDGNAVFLPENFCGGRGGVKAEITYGPKDMGSLRSPPSGHPVTVKFSNRMGRAVSLKRIGANGIPETVKEISPRKAWVFNTFEGSYFIACERGRERDYLDLNHCWYYLVRRSGNPQRPVKVIITEPRDSSSSSSSSNSDSD